MSEDTPMPILPLLLTEARVAELLQLSIHTLRRERMSGRIGYTRLGSRIRYTENQVAAYLENQKVEPCHNQEKHTPDKLVFTGSQSTGMAHRGVEHGTTGIPDRHAAHHLAQLTFGKQS